MCKIENSIVLITGGTGTFGSEFVDYCIKKKAAEVRVFSRDEKKQYDLSQKYSDVNSLKFYIGDVRDASSLEYAMKGVDFVFHAFTSHISKKRTRIPVLFICGNTAYV